MAKNYKRNGQGHTPIGVKEVDGKRVAYCDYCEWEGSPKDQKKSGEELFKHVKSADHCDLRDRQDRYGVAKFISSQVA